MARCRPARRTTSAPAPRSARRFRSLPALSRWRATRTRGSWVNSKAPRAAYETSASRRNRGFPRRRRDGVRFALRIAHVEMRRQRNLGEMLEIFGLAKELPALKRPVGRLLTTEGRQRPVATYVLHENL